MQLSAALWRVIAGTTLVVLSFSLLNPVMAVRLEHMGTSATAIGFFAMLQCSAELRLQPFLWAKDLASPDTVGHLFGIGAGPARVAPGELRKVADVVDPSGQCAAGIVDRRWGPNHHVAHVRLNLYRLADLAPLRVIGQ